MLNPVYVPAAEPSAWRALQARPDLHWRPGHSAYELAHAWSREGWPHEVVSALHAAGPALAGLEMLLALPEHRVPLPGGGHPSQTDLMVYAHNLGGALVVLAIEGKVAEPFGPLVGEWRADASGGKEARLHALRRTLGLDDGPELDVLRYQLLHRAASALIEAGRFSAQHAVLLVHSFDPQDPELADLGALARAVGCDPPPLPGEVRRAAPGAGPVLWLGWHGGPRRRRPERRAERAA